MVFDILLSVGGDHSLTPSSLCQFYIGNKDVFVIGEIFTKILTKHLFAKNLFRSACVA